MPIISINHIVAFLWILTSPKTGLMLKSVAVFDGGAVHYLFKNDIEVGGAVEARQLRYFIYLQMKIYENKYIFIIEYSFAFSMRILWI